MVSMTINPISWSQGEVKIISQIFKMKFSNLRFNKIFHLKKLYQNYIIVSKAILKYPQSQGDYEKQIIVSEAIFKNPQSRGDYEKHIIVSEAIF